MHNASVRDRDVRIALSLSEREAARSACVGRPTLRAFEADPMTVGKRDRARLITWYARRREELAARVAEEEEYDREDRELEALETSEHAA
jgi:hypothetical protein